MATFLSAEQRESVRRECLEELRSNTIDLGTSARRAANCGAEASLSDLLSPPLDSSLTVQYRRKFDYLDSESDG
jgi:hypothetical protein